MKKAAVSLAAILVLLYGSLPAAGQTEAVYRETSWEQLLPDTVRGEEVFSGRFPANGGEVAAYIERRINAPVNPDLHDRNIKIQGFVVPLERNEDSSLTAFLLAPYFGACIHVPPPPQNQIIHVVLDQPAKGIQSMDRVVAYGRIGLESTSSELGDAAYKMSAVKIEREAPLSAPHSALALGLTLLCGMSVCLGWVGPFSAVRPGKHMLSLGTAFAAGVMVCLGFSTVAANIAVETVGLFFLGAVFMALVEFLLHARGQPGVVGHGKRCAANGSALAIAVHNLPECFIVLSGTMTDVRLGFALGGAMIAHNVPLGISVALSSPTGGEHPYRAWGRAVLAGGVPPLAAILAYFSLRPLFSPDTVQMLFSGAGGALVYVALAKLVPLARQHGTRSTVLAGFGAGVLFLLLTLMFSYRS